MIPKITNLSAWIADTGIEAKAQSLATINAIADTVYRYLDLKTLVDHAVNVILEYIPVKSVALFLLDDSAEWLDLTAWRDFTEDTLDVGSRLPVHGSFTGLTIRQQDVIVCNDLGTSQLFEPRVQQRLVAQGLNGCISIPLLSQGKAYGAANLIFSGTRDLTSIERETLLAIGKTIGLAIANAQHVNRIEKEIEERRRVEADLRQYREHLEELVTARTAELAIAQQHAEQVSQAKTVFLSNMSHEVRTPLNVIIGYASSMCNHSPIYGEAELPEIYRKDLQLILDNGQYILRLINDLLDLSKIEAGRLELFRTETDLAPILQDVVADTTALLEGKPIEVRTRIIEPLPFIWADPVRVRQIALNLVSNAIKFTRTGSVTIETQVDQTSGFVSVSVIDTGIGIPDHALPHLFERFQPTTQKGTGLGLNISKQFTQMHGGELTVSSVVGQGSTFTFTLPIAENQAAVPRLIGRASQDPITIFKASAETPDERVALLLIQDAALREQVKEMLEGDGCIVLAVNTLEQAQTMITSFAPGLLFVDVPASNFRDLAAAVRLLDPNLLIAAIADQFCPVDSDLFFVKPLAPEKVLTALRQKER